MIREVSISRAPESATAVPRHRRRTAPGGTGSRRRCRAPWPRRSARHASPARPSSPVRRSPDSCWRNRRSRSPEHAGRLARLHLVPAELRHADLVREPADMTGHDAQAPHAGALVAGLEQELMPDADGDGRPVGRDPLAAGPIQPKLDQPRHRRAERADARQHDVRCARGSVAGRLAHPRLGAEAPERRHHRGDVGGPVGTMTTSGDRRHSTPLVLGTSPGAVARHRLRAAPAPAP